MVDVVMTQDACFSWNCIWNPGCELECPTHDNGPIRKLVLGMVEITWCGCLKKEGLCAMQGQHKVSKQPEADLIVKQLLPTPTLRIQCLGLETMCWIQRWLIQEPRTRTEILGMHQVHLRGCRDLSGGWKDASSLSAAFLLLPIQPTLLKIGKKKYGTIVNFFKSNVNSIHKEVHWVV